MLNFAKLIGLLVVLGIVLTGCRTLPPEELPDWQLSVGGAGGGGAEAAGYLVAVEGEYKVAEKFTVLGQLRHYGYEWDDDTDKEEGSGTGIGAEARWYPTQAMNGYWLGAGLGVYPSASWDYYENGRKTDSDDEVVAEFHASTGWTFRFGKAIGLTPFFTVGSYASSSPESGPYAGIGLMLNIGF